MVLFAMLDVPKLASAGIVFELPHYPVIAQELEIIYIATLFQFQFRFEKLTIPILATMIGDNDFQGQDLPGVAQAANFVMIAPSNRGAG